MGLWDWVTGLLNGDGDDKKASRDDGGSVAVLDGEPGGAGSESTPYDSWWAPDGVTTTEPVPVTAPHLTAEARALENILASHFDSHNLDMPPLPHAAEKALRRLADRNYDAHLLAGDISEDPVIAAAVLRMANSALYGGRNKITALQPAITRLGTNAVRTLMLHQSLRAAAFGRSAGDPELTELVWYRSLAGGCVMRALSGFAGMNADEAFMIGLLHDIGNVIVLREVCKQQSVLSYKTDLDTFDYLCAECHQEFGELVAIAWQLPPDLQSLLSDHHRFPDEDEAFRNQRLLVQLTDMINAMIGYAPAASYDLLNTRVVKALGLSDRDDFVEFLIELPGTVEINVASVSF